MAEFILDQNVKFSSGEVTKRQATTGKETKSESLQIGTKGDTDNFHLMAQLYQAFHDDPVIEIPACEGRKIAVDDKTDTHQRPEQ